MDGWWCGQAMSYVPKGLRGDETDFCFSAKVRNVTSQKSECLGDAYSDSRQS